MPSLITTRYPSPKFSCLAIVPAIRKRCPSIGSSRALACCNWSSFPLFFGTRRTCVGAQGDISLNAKHSSSSNTFVEGIFPAIILSKIDSSTSVVGREVEEDVDVDYINDEDNLISFLNEYYVVYPKKIPKAEYKWKIFYMK